MFDEELEDFDKLRHLNDNSCSAVIESFINTQNVKMFFRCICMNFNSNISDYVAESILNSLTYLLSNRKNAHIFIDNNLLSTLPFNNPNLADSIFDLLYYLVMLIPERFEQQHILSITPLIKENPYKILLLLYIYSQKYSSIDNPWPVTDVLFTHSKDLYITPNADFYIRILSTLSKHKSFIKERKKAIWVKLWKCIGSAEQIDLIKCYQAAIPLAKLKLKPPKEIVMKHIQFKKIKDAVLTFLLHSASMDSDEATLEKLIQLSQTDIKASLVLLKMAQVQETAQLLAEHPDWMNIDLPTTRQTFKLFLIIFSFQEFRQAISNYKDTYVLLRNLSKSATPLIFHAISSVLKRLPLCKESIKIASEAGLFRSLFSSSIDDNRPESLHAAFITGLTISSICYTKELLMLTKPITESISEGTEIKSIAIAAVRELSRHQKILSSFRDAGLPDILRETKGRDAKAALEILDN